MEEKKLPNFEAQQRLLPLFFFFPLPSPFLLTFSPSDFSFLSLSSDLSDIYAQKKGGWDAK